jgi:1-acyl-sn-glycerol-3-phosphate acyltransferase/acyl carrier protein
MFFLKKFLSYSASILFRIYHRVLIPLRYKLAIQGTENIRRKTDPAGGILFLGSHPSHLDATFLTYALFKQGYKVNIWTLEYVFKNPYTRFVARNPNTVKLMKVPNLYSSRAAKNPSRMRRLIAKTIDKLRAGENVLFFPSGNQKHTAREEIHGKSAVHRILKQYPNANIFVAQITGMWGSRFSKAVKKSERSTAKGENWFQFVWNLVKIVLLNFVIFIPKRSVSIEFQPVAEDFPRTGTRKEINKYLERYFNKGFEVLGEPVVRVPNYFWKNTYAPIEYHLKSYNFNLENVPKALIDDVLDIVARKSLIVPENIELNMLLDRDLSLDSLEISEILIELEHKYKMEKCLPKDVHTIGHLIALVAKCTIDYAPILGTFHEERQQVPFLVRAGHACAMLLASAFNFLAWFKNG